MEQENKAESRVTKRRVSLLLAVVAVGIVGLFVAGNAAVMTRRGQDNATRVLGATIRNEDYAITLKGMLVGQANETKGTERITIQVVLTNTSSVLQQISPGLQMHLVSDTGTVYPITAEYVPADMSLGGPLEPQQSMDLSVDFNIPMNETPQTLTFQPDSAKQTATIGLQ